MNQRYPVSFIKKGEYESSDFRFIDVSIDVMHTGANLNKTSFTKAESVVAITQGRAMRCEEFHPGPLAKVLSHLFPAKGSISSWYSMQSLIDAEGGARVLWAVKMIQFEVQLMHGSDG